MSIRYGKPVNRPWLLHLARREQFRLPTIRWTINFIQIGTKICCAEISRLSRDQMKLWRCNIVPVAITAVALFQIFWTLWNYRRPPILLSFTRHWDIPRDDSETKLQFRNHYLESAPLSSKCLTATLYAVNNAGGTGNIMFELLGLYAIAQRVGRVAVVYDDALNDKIGEISKNFPNIRQFFREATTCGSPTFVDVYYKGCCTFDENITNTISSHDDQHSITVKLFYLQSYKFFNNLHPHVVRHFFNAAPHVQELAASHLFQNKPKKDNLNICIHIRRGDFKKSADSLASEEDFTRIATDYVIAKAQEEDSRPSYLHVMSDDNAWTRNTFRTYKRTNIASHNSTPPGTEWEFSRMFCDRVLLTASMSTYGYWIGYFSRGQKVYYNYAFTPEFEKQLGPTDFWPPHWTAIQYNRQEKNITEWIPPNSVFDS
ncbi:hypothetical protein Y032_0187g1127 [Ancylostoma ceylanicum]|uniref:L-Fucosyltransferase n=1 Tax=Ancylostoma ceylanicum TaxID=53326 RepID=A0A016SRN6_9BILA|nr:hypothetical protein Y032_0187g1127 [Ancylostoma ceylanicum]